MYQLEFDGYLFASLNSKFTELFVSKGTYVVIIDKTRHPSLECDAYHLLTARGVAYAWENPNWVNL